MDRKLGHDGLDDQVGGPAQRGRPVGARAAGRAPGVHSTDPAASSSTSEQRPGRRRRRLRPRRRRPSGCRPRPRSPRPRPPPAGCTAAPRRRPGPAGWRPPAPASACPTNEQRGHGQQQQQPLETRAVSDQWAARSASGQVRADRSSTRPQPEQDLAPRGPPARPADHHGVAERPGPPPASQATRRGGGRTRGCPAVTGDRARRRSPTLEAGGPPGPTGTTHRPGAGAAATPSAR